MTRTLGLIRPVRVRLAHKLLTSPSVRAAAAALQTTAIPPATRTHRRPDISSNALFSSTTNPTTNDHDHQRTRPLVAAGYGRIINVLSTAGFTPIPDIGGIASGATKAGLAKTTRYLAKECAPVVRANMLCPGTIDSQGEMRPIWEQNIPRIPLGRVGAADAVVGVALLLASEASSYISGQVIFVDGGRVNTAS